MAQTKELARKSRPASGKGQFRSFHSALTFLRTATDYETMSRVSYNHNTFNLSRMSRLLQSIGHPQKKLRSVHIAGTKGKGSTAVMVSSMLRQNGYTVGLYTSPHVLNIRERIVVNDIWISEPEFVRCLNAVAPFVRGAKSAKPTFFELITAMAFLHFAEQEVDIAVIETGLGGRLDATNVIKPDVCAITSISLDHTAQLGSNIESIAEEKAGIFKPGIPAISAPQPESVKNVLRRIAEKQGAPLMFTGQEIEFSYRFESPRMGGPHSRVCLSTPTSHFEHLPVPLPGEHQAINCGVALSIIDVLKGRGFEIDDQRAVEGLATARLPGRMEIIRDGPKILVDGAHNAASIEALMRTIGQSVSYDSMIVIFGCQTGKDIPGMIRHIQLGADKIIFTRSTAPNAAEPQSLAAVYQEQSGATAQTCENLEEAMRIAQGAVSSEDLICITGSFYLVGEAKRMYPNSAARIKTEIKTMWARGSLEDLQDGINRLFEQVWHSGLKTGPFDGQDWAPLMDVVDKPDRYVLELELPGLANEDVEVTATASSITIQGQKPPGTSRQEGDTTLLSERRHGSFKRIVKLSEAIDSQRLSANLRHGVLRIEAPKTQARRDPTIKVRVEESPSA